MACILTVVPEDSTTEIAVTGKGKAMSCRIDREVGKDGVVVLLISGKLTAECVDLLGNALRQETGAVAFDLKNVSLVDRPAVQLLALAEHNGTEIRNCPKYVREWVRRERADMGRES